MSIWSHLWAIQVWEVHYQPEPPLLAEVSAATASSWNDCLRLSVAESPGWRRSAAAMLDRDQARELAQRLLDWADRPTRQRDDSACPT